MKRNPSNLFVENPMLGYDRKEWTEATGLNIYDVARVQGVLGNVGESLGDMNPANPEDLEKVLATAVNLRAISFEDAEAKLKGQSNEQS